MTLAECPLTLTDFKTRSGKGLAIYNLRGEGGSRVVLGREADCEAHASAVVQLSPFVAPYT